MSVQKQAKVAAQNTVAQTEAETQDEIEQIMSEIEELQAEMTVATTPKPALKVVPNEVQAETQTQPQAQTQAVENARSFAIEEVMTAETTEASLSADLEAAVDASLEADASLAEIVGETGETGEDVSVDSGVNELTEASESVDSSVDTSLDSIDEEVLKEFQAGAEEVGMEETLSDLKPEPAPISNRGALSEIMPRSIRSGRNPVRTTSRKRDDDFTFRGDESADEPASNAGPGADGVLSMTLQGSMALRLNYQTDGQEVIIAFSDGFLQIKLTDGTEFKIPVARKN